MTESQSFGLAPKLFCRGLSRSFEGVAAVANLCLDVLPTQVAALIGPNGAGKTTLFHLLAGTLKPDSGSVFLDELEITGMSVWRIAELGVGRLFQDVRLFRKLSVRENIAAPLVNRNGHRLASALLHPWGSARRRRACAEHAEAIGARFGLQEVLDKSADEISWGESKLTALARLAAANARVLLLDEPTSGLNPAVIGNVINLLRELAAEGRTILVVEHDMGVVTELADIAHFIDEGQIQFSAPPAALLANEEVRRRYTGSTHVSETT